MTPGLLPAYGNSDVGAGRAKRGIGIFFTGGERPRTLSEGGGPLLELPDTITGGENRCNTRPLRGRAVSLMFLRWSEVEAPEACEGTVSTMFMRWSEVGAPDVCDGDVSTVFLRWSEVGTPEVRGRTASSVFLRDPAVCGGTASSVFLLEPEVGVPEA